MNAIKQNIKPNALALCGIHIFDQLTYQQRCELVSLFRYSEYQPTQEIISYHDHSTDVYFVISGQVQATIFSLSGRQIVLNDLGPGDMFGELSAIDSQPRSAYVLATTKATIWSISAKDFWYVLRHYQIVNEATLKRLVGLIRQLCGRVLEISTLPVKNRIQIELLRLAMQQQIVDDKVAITPVPTHNDIANHIGTHREAVSRELASLKNSGVIERYKNVLVVVDLKRLCDLVREATGFAYPQLEAS